MKVRVRMIGTGTDLDPYRVPLPHYQMIQEDYVSMKAIVEVVRNSAPDDVPVDTDPRWVNVGPHRVLTGMGPLQRLAWIAKLRKRYPGHPLLQDPDVQ